MAVVAMCVLVMAALSLVVPRRATGEAYGDSLRYELAERSVREQAAGMLLDGTWREHFVTHTVPVAHGRLDTVTVLSWFDPEEEGWQHQPLYSRAQLVPATSEEQEEGGDRYVPMEHTVEQGENPVLMTGLGPGQEQAFSAPRVELGDGISYGYWVEDLGGYLALEELLPLVQEERYLTEEEQQQRAQAGVWDIRQLGLSVFHDGAGHREFPADTSVPGIGWLPNAEGEEAPPVHPLQQMRAQKVPAYGWWQALIRENMPEEYAELAGYLTTGLAETVECEVVPFGHLYQNAGEAPLNLNAIVTQAGTNPSGAVDQLAAQLRNVRGFQDNAEQYAQVGITVNAAYPEQARYGGFPAATESYTRTLAANMIDYADEGGVPTVSVKEGEEGYRGIDAMPYYTESARRYYFSDLTAGGIVLQIRNFIELHNPSNLPVRGQLRVVINPDASQAIEYDGASYPLPPEGLYYWNEEVHIPPNGYRVIELTRDLDGDAVGEPRAYVHYELAHGTDGSAAAPVLTGTRGASSGNQQSVYWRDSTTPDGEFLPVDGLPYSSYKVAATSLIDTMDKNANTTLHGSPLYEDMTGDPRAKWYYQGSSIGALNYARRSSFGGANHYQLAADGVLEIEANYPDAWYDPQDYGSDVRGCDASPSRGMRYPGEYGYVKYDNPEGSTSENLEHATSTPGSKSQYYPEPRADAQLRYTQQLSNRGHYTSLGELGAIYDPAQWRAPQRDVGYPLIDDSYARGTDGALLKAEELGRFGGGLTLAVGSPEFNSYSARLRPERRGYEAARLLDQLRVTASPLRSLRGRVNLNTASRPVLRALFAGFTHQADGIMGAFTHQPQSVPGEVASALADGLIAARQEHPFLSLSDIALARAPVDELPGARVAVFGEPAQYQTASLLPPQRWNDTGREELFRQLCDLFTTQSRSYRIHYQIEVQRQGRRGIERRSIDVTLHPYLNDDLTVDRTRAPRVRFHNLIIR